MKYFSDETKFAIFIETILREDLSEVGDVTTLSTVPENLDGRAIIIAKQKGIVAGNWIAKMVFKNVDSALNYQFKQEDGLEVLSGDIIAEVSGPVRGILSAERTALNLLGRLSGVATLTHLFVERVKGTKAKILDTRKTTPGLRVFEKYAVRVGGGENHRYGLSDMVLIKENHIAAAGSIESAVKRCRQYMKEHRLDLKIEVETTNLQDVRTALRLKLDRIMLDNMSPESVSQAVQLVKGQVELEVSGGITLDNVSKYAATGVDFISVGALTHSAPILDISLLVDRVSPEFRPAGT